MRPTHKQSGSRVTLKGLHGVVALCDGQGGAAL